LDSTLSSHAYDKGITDFVGEGCVRLFMRLPAHHDRPVCTHFAFLSVPPYPLGQLAEVAVQGRVYLLPAPCFESSSVLGVQLVSSYWDMSVLINFFSSFPHAQEAAVVEVLL
jgi:hypothetical protein